MQSEPKAEELGSLLGLSLGMDAGPAPLPSMSDLSTAQRMVNASKTQSMNSQTAFWSKLAALYLPAILRTFFGMTDVWINIKDVLGPWEFYSGLAWTGICSFSFPRFIRAHPQEVVGFLTSIAKTLSHIPPMLLTLATDFTRSILPHKLKLLARLYEELLLHKPLDFPPISALDAATRKDLAQVAALARRTQIGPEAKESLAVLDLLTLDVLPQTLKPSSSKHGPVVTWRTCELNGFGPRDGVLTPCVKLAPGEEMPVCGRCHSLRYCSREHQKHDWKRHKLVCYEPSW